MSERIIEAMSARDPTGTLAAHETTGSGSHGIFLNNMPILLGSATIIVARREATVGPNEEAGVEIQGAIIGMMNAEIVEVTEEMTAGGRDTAKKGEWMREVAIRGFGGDRAAV